MIKKKNRIVFLFSVALLALVVFEITVVLSFVGNVRMPWIDSIGLYLLLSSLLLLGVGAVFMSWTQCIASLSHWVLAFWWSLYTAETLPINWLGNGTLDLSNYLFGENIRYLIGFILSSMVVVYLAAQVLGELRTGRTLGRIGLSPFIAALVVFLPWIGIDFLYTANEDIFPINSIEPTMFSFYSLEFLCVLLYDWFTEISDR